MAKLGNFEAPTGSKGNIFNVGDWGSMILGSFMLLFTFGIGQAFFQKVTGKYVHSAQIEQPWTTPTPIAATPQKITL
ncbi:MAG: hypothetical protein Q8906_06005 [Bacillota bacterium]|nr:hypothetical protein [Bacillota bacterium]